MLFDLPGPGIPLSSIQAAKMANNWTVSGSRRSGAERVWNLRAFRKISRVVLVFGVLSGRIAAETPSPSVRSSPETPKSQNMSSANVPEKLKETATPNQSPQLHLPSGGYVLIPSEQVVTSTRKEDRFVQYAGAVSSLLATIAWPSVVLVVALFLLRKADFQNFISRIFRQTTQLTVANFEIRMNQQGTATIDDLRNLIAQVPETYRDWLDSSSIETQFGYFHSDLEKYLTTFRDSGRPLTGSDFRQFRFTLHVADVILAHSLRQLVDYVGNDEFKSGRLFSIRHGIIGRAWRLERSEFVAQHSYSEDQLVEQWGMTRAEAKATTGQKNVFLAVCIKNARGHMLAVLFGDSADSELFKPARIGTTPPEVVFSRFEQKVNELCIFHGLTESLDELENARRKVKQFDPYGRRAS